MIVTITLDADPMQGEAPVMLQFGIVNPQAQLGEPSVTISWDGTRFSLEDMREHLRELEAIRDKYQSFVIALGRST
jgi:hypothetical protein